MSTAETIKRRSYQAAYYVKNKAAFKAAYHAAYHTTNRDAILARKAIYRSQNKALLNANGAVRRAKRPKDMLLYAAKRRAVEINHEFNLTVDAMQWSAECPCCGVELRYGGTGRFVPHSASVDRIDSSAGYTQENTWIICYRCNTIKNIGTPADLRRIADAVDAVIASRVIH